MATGIQAPPGTDLAVRLNCNRRGRDFVVGDVHGHFGTLRHALAELGVGEHDRVFSLGDLVDRGPDSWAAIDWMAGADAALRFDVVVRGNHEQMMLEGLQVPEELRRRKNLSDAWIAWQHNGGAWWNERETPPSVERAWSVTLGRLPYCARVETRRGWVGLVHASPVLARWEELEEQVQSDGALADLTRWRALWSRYRHRYMQSGLQETGTEEYVGLVEGVECVITGHTPVREPVWQENVLAIDTGVYIQGRGYGRLTIARIDGKELEIVSFQRREERCEGGLGRRERDTV